ncbi:hypothetical protein KA005_24240 [bacterium]|nr:hypothetical protein [bacterium]
MSPEESGINCVKGYGTIKFVQGEKSAYCPISGRGSCVDCDVITKGEAREAKQVTVEEKE